VQPAKPVEAGLDQFSRLDALPNLGTGKLDLRKAREIAVERSAAQGSAQV